MLLESKQSIQSWIMQLKFDLSIFWWLCYNIVWFVTYQMCVSLFPNVFAIISWFFQSFIDCRYILLFTLYLCTGEHVNLYWSANYYIVTFISSASRMEVELFLLNDDLSIVFIHPCLTFFKAWFLKTVR